MLDPTQQTPEETVTLLAGVENLRVSFFANGQWSDRWIVSGGGETLPSVIAIEFETEDFGTLRQLFVTPGSA